MSRGLPDDWDRRRRQVYRRDDHTCQNCGRTGGPRGDVELHAHHIVPKSKGGTHKTSNLKTVCSECHKAIHGDQDAPSARPQLKSIDEQLEETPSGIFQQRSNRSLNDRHNRCPNCNAQDSLQNRWLIPEHGSKVKVVQCKECEAFFQEAEQTLNPVEEISELDPTSSAFLYELKQLLRPYVERLR